MRVIDGRSRRDRITFERRTVTKNRLNEDVETWAEEFREWAATYYGSGSEQRAAAQTRGVQTASFEVLSNARTRAISVADHRIRFDGSVWNITAKHPIGANAGVRVTAVREVA